MANPLYVKTEDGRYLAQIDADNQWGFSLCDDDQAYPGGFNSGAHTWQVVKRSDVPQADQERLARWFDE